jgi:hypothetical protein
MVFNIEYWARNCDRGLKLAITMEHCLPFVRRRSHSVFCGFVLGADAKELRAVIFPDAQSWPEDNADPGAGVVDCVFRIGVSVKTERCADVHRAIECDIWKGNRTTPVLTLG